MPSNIPALWAAWQKQQNDGNKDPTTAQPTDQLQDGSVQAGTNPNAVQHTSGLPPDARPNPTDVVPKSGYGANSIYPADFDTMKAGPNQGGVPTLEQLMAKSVAPPAAEQPVTAPWNTEVVHGTGPNAQVSNTQFTPGQGPTTTFAPTQEQQIQADLAAHVKDAGKAPAGGYNPKTDEAYLALLDRRLDALAKRKLTMNTADRDAADKDAADIQKRVTDTMNRLDKYYANAKGEEPSQETTKPTAAPETAAPAPAPPPELMPAAPAPEAAPSPVANKFIEGKTYVNRKTGRRVRIVGGKPQDL
jgi:hypothetical protein